jgi:phage nucleotide-binding protein
VSLAAIAGLEIHKVSQRQHQFNMLVYGESGTGKTVLAGSADAIPEMRRVLFVDVEAGTLSLKNFYPDVEVVRVKSWQEMQEVYDELNANQHGFRTIVIDSLTECQKMSMAKIMKKVVEEYEDRDADVPGLREWNINIEQTRKFVRAFRDLPVNTIFTALMKTDRNPRTGAIKRKPSLSGKVADEVAGFLDIVTYLYLKEVEGTNNRMLLCGQTEDTVAKDRTGKLAQVVASPTMSEIWKAVREGSHNDISSES